MRGVPPILPEKTLQRVLAIARADGWSIVIVAGLSGLISLFTGSWLGTGVGAAVVLAGVGELHGRHRLATRDRRGVAWLVGAQLFLLAAIWFYAWYRWRFFDPAALWARLPAFAQAEIDRQLLTAGLEPAYDRFVFVRAMNVIVCAVLAFVSAFYQGGLALYYLRQRDRLRQALAAGDMTTKPGS